MVVRRRNVWDQVILGNSSVLILKQQRFWWASQQLRSHLVFATNDKKFLERRQRTGNFLKYSKQNNFNGINVKKQHLRLKVDYHSHFYA